MGVKSVTEMLIIMDVKLVDPKSVTRLFTRPSWHYIESTYDAAASTAHYSSSHPNDKAGQPTVGKKP